MSFNLTWEIGVLMNDYANRKPLETKEKKLYAQAIELNCKKGYGLIMPIDMCIDWVTKKLITDYDGIGELLNKDGEIIDDMCCDVSFLKRAKENGAYFVAWYNK